MREREEAQDAADRDAEAAAKRQRLEQGAGWLSFLSRCHGNSAVHARKDRSCEYQP